MVEKVNVLALASAKERIVIVYFLTRLGFIYLFSYSEYGFVQKNSMTSKIKYEYTSVLQPKLRFRIV